MPPGNGNKLLSDETTIHYKTKESTNRHIGQQTRMANHWKFCDMSKTKSSINSLCISFTNLCTVNPYRTMAINTESKGTPTLFNNECEFHMFLCPCFTLQRVLNIKMNLTNRIDNDYCKEYYLKKLHVSILAWVIVWH
jgi:hypothetical protein